MHNDDYSERLGRMISKQMIPAHKRADNYKQGRGGGTETGGNNETRKYF